MTDGEVWNEGVEYYRAGDVTNALRVLRPLILTKSHGARAAEVVAKLEYERGNLEEAANAAQIALRAAPDDAKANRNFTRATDRLPAIREEEHLKAVLKAAEGKDPGAMLLAATKDCRALMAESGAYRTNRAEKAVALADALSKRAERLSDSWIPVRELIAQSVTNEEQAATISAQIDAARKKTKDAAKRLSDLDAEAYPLLSDVEHDFTRFVKLTVMPPAAMDEDLVAQSNAWMDAEQFNGRSWQRAPSARSSPRGRVPTSSRRRATRTSLRSRPRTRRRSRLLQPSLRRYSLAASTSPSRPSRRRPLRSSTRYASFCRRIRTAAGRTSSNSRRTTSSRTRTSKTRTSSRISRSNSRTSSRTRATTRTTTTRTSPTRATSRTPRIRRSKPF